MSAEVRNPNEVAIFIYRGDRFLVLHRVHERKVWHVIAGVVETSESFPAAAARELREETGLEASITDLAAPRSYVIEDDYLPQYALGTTEVLVHTFAVQVPAEWEPVLNDEHNEYRWCTLSEALELLHWPEARDALRELGSRLGLA